MTNGTSGNIKIFFFVAATNKLKTITGWSKNSVKDKIRERGILKKNVVIFKFSVGEEKQFEYKVICNKKFKLHRAHYTILKKACRAFLREEFNYFF